MTSTGVTSIDQLAQERFLHHFSRNDPVSEAITILSYFFNKSYAEAIGYEFSWGHILERRFNQYIVWDFFLSTLLMAYLHAGQRLDKALQLCPSSSVDMFRLLVHISSEDQAKHWVVRELLSAFPELIARAQRYLNATPAAR